DVSAPTSGAGAAVGVPGRTSNGSSSAPSSRTGSNAITGESLFHVPSRPTSPGLSRNSRSIWVGDAWESRRRQIGPVMSVVRAFSVVRVLVNHFGAEFPGQQFLVVHR